MPLLDRRWFPLVLVAAWAAAYLPYLGEIDLRLEEGRRATPAREMLASGDWVRPTLYGDTYLNKPPLHFWLIAAVGAMLGGVDPLAARVPSALAALACALVAYRFAPATLDRRTRALAALFTLAACTLLDKGRLGEIDAVLCLLVAAAFKVWWDGHGPDRQTTGSWLAAGAVLGVAGLLKGPAGPAVFYLTVGPYLVWQGRWRSLFSGGHLIGLAVSALPAAWWVGALLDRGLVSEWELLVLWQNQVGADVVAYSVIDPAACRDNLVHHYTRFLPEVLGMFFPAVLFVPFALRRRWATAHGLSEDLRRFLVCGTVVPVVVMYLYPGARPRHLMPAFIPAAILAATVAAGMARAGRRPLGTWLAGGLAWSPAALGLIGVGLAAVAHPPGLPAAAAGLVVGLVWTWVTVRAARQTAAPAGALRLAVTLCGTCLATWAVVNTVVVPWLAPRGESRVAARVGERLDPAEVVYTTRRFPITGNGYFNRQFHIARDLRGADVGQLRELAPCTAIVTPAERLQLEQDGLVVEAVGAVPGENGYPPVDVVRLRLANLEH